MDSTVGTSASTIRTIHINTEQAATGAQCSTHIANTSGGNSGPASQPSSPRSSILPSPPDSPLESLSSISSSFFFSSAAASPPHALSHLQPDHGREPTQGLIIPSLTLPAALRRPTPYGQTLGDVRLFVLGAKGVGKTVVSNFVVEDNEDVVEVAPWEEGEHGMVLRASTDWIEHNDAHGLQKFEPLKNVEITELPGYFQTDDADQILRPILSMIQAPFHSARQVLHPDGLPSPLLVNLLSSPSSPLYTALILVVSGSPSLLEHHLIDHLSSHVPLIVLPSSVSSHSPFSYPYPFRPILSSFRPTSLTALKRGIFRTPETLSTLRTESADRFLRWREVELTVEDILSVQDEDRRKVIKDITGPDGKVWTKARWEAEWAATFSQDVASRLASSALSSSSVSFSLPANHKAGSTACVGLGLDPLHFPSLLAMSFSLFGPLRASAARAAQCVVQKVLDDVYVRIALVGGLCLGIGIGWMLQ